LGCRIGGVQPDRRATHIVRQSIERGSDGRTGPSLSLYMQRMTFAECGHIILISALNSEPFGIDAEHSEPFFSCHNRSRAPAYSPEAIREGNEYGVPAFRSYYSMRVGLEGRGTFTTRNRTGASLSLYQQ